MNTTAVRLAARIVAGSGREVPADALLRQELRQVLSATDRRDVARAVFSFFRWRGWADPACLDAGASGAGEPGALLQPNRRLEDRLVEALSLQDRFNADPAGFSAAELAERCVPRWVSRFLEPTDAWLRSLQVEPAVWLRARSGMGALLQARLGACQPASAGLADCLQYRGTADLYRVPEFQAGDFEIQDIASQMVSVAAAPRPGEKWWDVCAGEGGKTLHLAGLMGNRGLIVATDRAEWRLRRLRQRAARARVFNYRAQRWDGAIQAPLRTPFDGVLIDAPCSGLGTWQKNPHARWTTTPRDVEELAGRQLALLNRVAPAVKPGGRLVYAVCTLTRPETGELAAAFRQNRSFTPLAISSPDEPGGIEAAEHWWWPHRTGGNGMYVALWRREPA